MGNIKSNKQGFPSVLFLCLVNIKGNFKLTATSIIQWHFSCTSNNLGLAHIC